MLISALCPLPIATASKKMGEVWKPKTSTHMVGRDVNALTQTSPVLSPNRDLVLAKGEDSRFTSEKIFSSARSIAAKGGWVKNFRLVDVEKLNEGSVASPGNLTTKSGMSVSLNGDLLLVTGKDGLLASCRVSGDTRLCWDSEGMPVFHTGAQALSASGTLRAEGADEVLIRLSGCDVEAGARTTVLNLSDAKGTFSGGDDVRYLGAYGQGSHIKGGRGRTSYAGYFNGARLDQAEGAGDFSGVFENQAIELIGAANNFSGYFRSCTVNGGKNNDAFSGLFLAGTTLNGGHGDDKFSGRFIDSVLDGGDGNDSFGRGVELSNQAVLLTDAGGSYGGLASDFVETIISGGNGDDRFNSAMWKGSLDLGGGNNQSRGVFTQAGIQAGSGNDRLTALYADFSTFESGDGDDSIELATARTCAVSTGDGDNSVILGRNTGTRESDSGQPLGGDPVMGTTTFSTPEEYSAGWAGIRFGELSGNIVHAEQGENAITMRDGSGEQRVITGWKKSDGGRNPEAQEAQAAGSAFAKAALLSDPASAARKEPSERKTGGLTDNLDKSRAEKPDATALDSLKQESFQADMRRACGRYALMLGQGPEHKGGIGARVATGTENDMDLAVKFRYRHEIDKNPEMIRKFRARYNGYSSRLAGSPYL